MNWRVMLKSIAVAGMSGAVTSAPIAIAQAQSPDGRVNWPLFGVLLATGAGGGVTLYLRQSPMAPQLPKPQDPPKS
jgi:hypothetical protein